MNPLPAPEDLPQAASPAQRRRALAQQGFLRELCASARNTWGLAQREPPHTPEFSSKTLVVPLAGDVETQLQKSVGLCDRMFRTQSLGKPTTTPLDWPLSWPREGAAVRRTIQFEDACACYRPGKDWCGPPTTFHPPPLPNGILGDTDALDLSSGLLPDDPESFTLDFFAFTQAVCGKEVPEDAYGTGWDIIKFQCVAQKSFTQARSATRELITAILLSAPRLIGGGLTNETACKEKAPALFAAYMASLPAREAAAAWQRIETRCVALRAAWSTVQLLQARVDKNVRDRRASGSRHLESMCGDTLASVARYLSPEAASALARTCKGFLHVEALREKMPHFRIRHVAGAFPHERLVSRDRADLARRINKPVMRNFVVSRNAVRLHVDFIVRTLRTPPLKKLPRKDGLCNATVDYSDDEFEEAPERAAKRGPQGAISSMTAGLVGSWAHRQRGRDRRRRQAWEAADGPPEKLDRFAYDQRLPYSDYFRVAPTMTPSLVFADDHTQVPCAQHKGALSLSTAMRKGGGLFWQPRNGEAPFEVDCHMPATARFHVPHLSRDHGDRLFKIKVVAKGELLNGTPFLSATFSEPFEAVGKLQTAQQAGKRALPPPVQHPAAKSRRR